MAILEIWKIRNYKLSSGSEVLLLLIGMQSKNLDLRDMDMLEPDRISICTWIICWWTPFLVQNSVEYVVNLKVSGKKHSTSLTTNLI